MTATTPSFRKPVDSLRSGALGVSSINFDWSNGFGERWQTVYPDTSKLTVAECKEVLDDLGVDNFPDPNPFTDDKQTLFDLLIEANEADDFAVDPEADELVLRDDVTVEALREKVIEEIDNEYLDGIEKWRDKAREAYQEDDSERFNPMMNYYYPLPDFDGNEAGEGQLLLDRHGGAVAIVELDPNGDTQYALALTGGGMDLRWDICEGFMLLGYLPPVYFVDLPRFAGKQLTERAAWIIDGCIEACKTQEEQAAFARKRLEEYKAKLSSPGGAD